MTTTNAHRPADTADEPAVIEMTDVITDESGQSVLGRFGYGTLPEHPRESGLATWGYGAATGTYTEVRSAYMRTRIEQLFTSRPAVNATGAHLV